MDGNGSPDIRLAGPVCKVDANYEMFRRELSLESLAPKICSQSILYSVIAANSLERWSIIEKLPQNTSA